jgi:hypothetical protein
MDILDVEEHVACNTPDDLSVMENQFGTYGKVFHSNTSAISSPRWRLLSRPNVMEADVLVMLNCFCFQNKKSIFSTRIWSTNSLAIYSSKT